MVALWSSELLWCDPCPVSRNTHPYLQGEGANGLNSGGLERRNIMYKESVCKQKVTHAARHTWVNPGRGHTELLVLFLQHT